ncbi:hypothetical protein [Jatrophihabitans fulvus]
MVPARRAVAAALAVAATVLTACSTVDGSGSVASGASAVPSGFPSAPAGTAGPVIPSSVPGSAAPGSYRCPDARFPLADLSFTCVTDGMTVSSGPVFSPVLSREVEAGTGWRLEMSAERWNQGPSSAPAIVQAISQEQVGLESYGEDPTVRQVQRTTRTVSGRPAYLAVDDITINPTWARSEGTKVKVERRWLMVVETTTDNFSVFFASIPDLEKQLWPRMGDVLDSVKIL